MASWPPPQAKLMPKHFAAQRIQRAWKISRWRRVQGPAGWAGLDLGLPWEYDAIRLLCFFVPNEGRWYVDCVYIYIMSFITNSNTHKHTLYVYIYIHSLYSTRHILTGDMVNDRTCSFFWVSYFQTNPFRPAWASGFWPSLDYFDWL